MNKGKLLTRAIEACLKKENWTMEGDEFNRSWTIPVEFTSQGKQVVLDLCFKSACTNSGTVYEESVKIFTDKKRESSKSEPTRLYFMKQKFDEETMDELTQMLNGVEKTLSFKKGDLTKFLKSQPQLSVTGEIVEKKGRGRPKKIVEEVIAVEKRGRGRPRKEVPEKSSVPMVAVSILD